MLDLHIWLSMVYTELKKSHIYGSAVARNFFKKIKFFCNHFPVRIVLLVKGLLRQTK